MNIADLIAALQRGDDPNKAIPAQFAPGQVSDSPAATASANPGIRPEYMQSSFMPPIPGPSGQDAQAKAPPPPSGPPQGIPTPLTNPQPAAESPKATQSPPDLANMYMQLMKDNQNAQHLDSGLHLIAAGLSPYMASRVALIQGASGPGRGGGTGAPTASDLINIQKQQQATKDMLLRRAMVGGLAKQYGLSPEAATFLEASGTGKLDELIHAHETKGLTVHADAATGQQGFYDRNGKLIVKLGGEKPEEGDYVQGPQGPELRSKRTGTQMGPGVGLAPTESTRTDEAALAEINKERVAQNKPLMTREEYIVLKKPAGTNVNVSSDGTVFRQPPEGYDYERNPDGKVKIGQDGKPIMYSVSPKAIGEQKETAVDIAAKEKAASDVLKKEHKERVAAAFTASNVGDAVDTALKLADKPGATGTFAKWGRNLSPISGMAWDTLDAKLKTIDANNVVSALNAMRAASPSGGALGNVTEKENAMLSSIIAATNPNQDTKEFKKSMVRIKAAMMVMAENKYDDADGAARFQKDLKTRIDDLTATAVNNSGGSIKITPRVKQ